MINLTINLRQQVTLFTEDESWQIPTHTFPQGADPQLAYKILEEFGINGGHASVRIQSAFDGVIGAGLGSSGAFSVALIKAVHKYKNLSTSRLAVAQKAYDIEVNKLGWHGGRQDPIASSLGGLNYISFGKSLEISTFSKDIIEALTPYLILVYTGGSRKSHEVQPKKELSSERKQLLDRLKTLTSAAFLLLDSGKIQDTGLLLHETWLIKKLVNPSATTEKIDEIYDYAKQNGALGGKALGAGGAGYMLFFVEPEKRQYFLEKMKEKGIENIDFGPDLNGVETRIL